MRIAARFFKEKVDSLGDEADSYLVHELLEEINEPLYFAQFVAHAARHDLQYLCEAQLFDTLTSGFPRAVAQAIAGVATDPVDAGQYMDFLRDQTFRQTLLCHDDLSLKRALDLNAVFGLYAMSRAIADADAPDSEAAPAANFRDEIHNITFTTEHPVTQASMLQLCQRCPRAVLVDELLVAAAARSGDNTADIAGEDDRRILAANLLRAYSYSKELVSLHAFAPPVATTISDKPMAGPVARLRAQQRSYVTNQYHEQITVDPVSRFLLPLLDGAHDRNALLQAMSDGLPNGGEPVEQTAEAVGSVAASTPEEQLAEALDFLMRFALLVA